MIDIDALIDGATNEILPDDVKARAVLRLALAQLLILKSPGHAVVATALPLVAGGPRRLVHAILSRAQKDGCRSTCPTVTSWEAGRRSAWKAAASRCWRPDARSEE